VADGLKSAGSGGEPPISIAGTPFGEKKSVERQKKKKREGSAGFADTPAREFFRLGRCGTLHHTTSQKGWKESKTDAERIVGG